MSKHHITRKHLKAELYRRQQGSCPWCDKPLPTLWEATLDHIIPKSHGGDRSIDNMQLMHAQCNKEKGARCPGCPRCEIHQLLATRRRT